MDTVATMAGGLIPTVLISRLLLWITRSWNGGIPRLVLANGVSLLAVALIAGMGMADGGAFAGAEAAILYVPPQAVWLTFDLVRHWRGHKPVLFPLKPDQP